MKSLNIHSIYDRVFLRKAKFMFKVFHEKAPVYIKENFKLRSNVNNSIVLRSATAKCYVPPKPSTEAFKQSMRYSGCMVWNSLPETIKKADSLSSFHNRCVKWLLEG